MHIQFKDDSGLKSLLNHTATSQLDKPQNAIKVIDPLAAAEERLFKKLNETPDNHAVQEALRERLGKLNINDAFTAARDKNEDGTTWVNLDKSEVINGKTVITKEPYQVFVDDLTRRVNKGLADGESVEDLSKLLDEASQGAIGAHTEVRNILNSLGKLDKSSSEYINTSESFVRFGLDKESAKIQGEENIGTYLNSPLSTDKSLNFNITTNEGDEISISLVFNSDRDSETLTYGKSVSLKYNISGDINAKERKAFDELLGAVADASDALLNGSEFTELIGMEVFDGSQLKGFNLRLGGAELSPGQARNVYNFEYSHDNKKQHVYFSHHLRTSTIIDRNRSVGGSAGVSEMSLSSNIGGSYDQRAVQTMLDVIAQGNNVAHKDDANQKKSSEDNPSNTSLFANAVQTFFKTAERLGKAINHANKYLDNSVALANDMFNQLSETDPRYQGIDAEKKDRIQSGFSTLADHQLSFDQQNGVFSKVSRGYFAVENRSSEELFSDRNQYAVNFNQKTESKAISDSDNKLGHKIKQTRSYEGDAEKKQGVIARGNITKDKWQANETYSVSLAAIESSIIGLDQNRKRAESRDSFTYLGLGQYMRKESAELSNASSKIRMIDSFWAEKNSYENKGFRQFSIYNGRREEDLDKNSIVYVPHDVKRETLSMIDNLKKDDEHNGSFHFNAGSKTSENLTMIGELEKQLDKTDYRHKRIAEMIHAIEEIDQLINSNSNKIDFKT